MKKIFAFIIFLPLYSFAQTNLEPLANKFEAQVIQAVQAEKTFEKQRDIISEALKDGRCGAALFFNAANIYAQNLQYPEAQNLYEKSLLIYPDFYLAYRNLGYLFYGTNKYGEALNNFGKALELSGADSRKINRACAAALIALNRHGEALFALEQILVFSPDDEALLESKAICLFQTNQKGRLRKFCEEFLNKYPQNPKFWRMQARLDMEREDFLSAAASLEALRKMGLADAQDALLLADLYLKISLYDKAFELYKNAKPSASKAYELARFFAAKNESQKALLLAQNLEADSAQYWEIQALALIKENKDYKYALQTACKKNPANDFLSIKLAELHLKNNETESAKFHYGQAQKTYPQEAAFGLASAEIAEGNFLRAANILEALPEKYLDKAAKIYIEKLRRAANEK